jgi:type IV pilus assembly protein PilX
MNGRRRKGLQYQRGAVLMVVLVALVAMLISVIALSRSMDTHQLVAGNLAFRNSTVHSSDAGVQGAVQWMLGTAGTNLLNSNAPNRGYFAVIAEPNWDDEAFWSGCPTCLVNAADAAGNQVQWVIHRMCSAEGNYNAAGNSCSLLAATSPAASGGSFSSDAFNFTGTAQNYYRVTVRVLGPRNTSTLVQAFVSL